MSTASGHTASLYAIAAPSGGGKTSLITRLLEVDPQVRLSVSWTTRPARPGEIDGRHYHFIDEAGFRALVDRGAMLEYARVFGHWYGTGRATVEELLQAGYDVLLDIDWQGVRQVRAAYPACRSIFLLPPSLPELRRRLEQRRQDPPEIIERRMHEARAEIAHWQEFDCVVINDHFDAALADLQAIIRAGEPRRRNPPERLRELLAELLEKPC